MCKVWINRRVTLGLKTPSPPKFGFWKELEQSVTDLFADNNVVMTEIEYDDNAYTKSAIISYFTFHNFTSAILQVQSYVVSEGVQE